MRVLSCSPLHFRCPIALFGFRLGLGLLLLLAGVAHAAEPLRGVFLDPPLEARPRGYWVWPHGNFDYTAIRRELQEFKAKGIGGVDIFDLGVQDRKNVIPPGPGFMSPEQVDGIAFALREAQRLGLKMGLIVSSSWNAGATWTPPELASMNLVAWSETITGPQHYERELPFPTLPDTFSKPYGEYPLHVPRDENGKPLFHEDVAVLAYPVDASGSPRIADHEEVRILNDRFDDSGRLRWEVPPGRWQVMRAVLTNFGQRLWLPSDHSQGLIMDHFNSKATRFHFQTIIDRLESRLGPLQDTSLERLYLASYESNAGVIWTPGFATAFEQFNGYPITPYLPALFGVTVSNEETTERFLYDYRKTASELFIENLYREGSRICREHGLKLCSEAGGPGTPLHDVPTEDLKALGAVDVMRGEFWNGKQDDLDPDGFEILQVVKPIASAAHIYGRRIVEMEAFTSHINWQEEPDLFKKLADRAFCEGMTRVVYHTMSHNLPEAGRPGWTYQAGSHMNTNLTWWSMSEALHAYLARCSALLMQGRFVADVAYYYGHAIPNFAKTKHLHPGLGFGYDYDDVNTEVLLQASIDSDGRIVLPGGMRYAALVLPRRDRRMDLDVLQHLVQLLRDGATIIGPRPSRTYGLRGYPENEQNLQSLADHIWGASPPNPPYRKTVGKGSLVVGQTERRVLITNGILPDLSLHPPEAEAQIDFIHRQTKTADLYFLRNRGLEAIDFEAEFRVSGRAPELWNPDGGRMIPLAVFQSAEESTRLPLHLPPHGATFVVFLSDSATRPHIEAVGLGNQNVFPERSEGAPHFIAEFTAQGMIRCRATQPGTYQLHFGNGRTKSVTIPPDPSPRRLDGPWELRFPFGWGVPTRQTFPHLHSWTEADDAATRSFSGIATYTRRFDLDPENLPAGRRVLLDLGEVREVARIYLNGYDAGISCFRPHVIDITSFVRPGENSLVIEVANTWLNQLIAEDSMPEDERRTQTNLTRGPTSQTAWSQANPKPSGLLGPVQLRFPRHISVSLPR